MSAVVRKREPQEGAALLGQDQSLPACHTGATWQRECPQPAGGRTIRPTAPTQCSMAPSWEDTLQGYGNHVMRNVPDSQPSLKEPDSGESASQRPRRAAKHKDAGRGGEVNSCCWSTTEGAVPAP